MHPPVALYGILYSGAGQQPHQEGLHWKWSVNRTGTIGNLFSRVKKREISFPREQECGSFLDEFACVTAEYDDEQRTIKYTHPGTMPDDAMHATNYALIMAVRWGAIRRSYAE